MTAPAARRDAAKVRRKKMKNKGFCRFLKKQVEKHKMDKK